MSMLKGRATQVLDPQALKQSIEYAAEELAAGIDLAFSYFKSSEKATRSTRSFSAEAAPIYRIFPHFWKNTIKHH